jgi:hypothetical protein
MDDNTVDRLTTLLSRLISRRATTAGLAALTFPIPADARKRKHKKKRKKKCGKSGHKPVEGKCCGKSILVDGACQRCDVCSSGCDFTSVQDAINAANPGATIALCPGTYDGTIVIDQNISLLGAGSGEGSGTTILQWTFGGPVVSINSGCVALEHLRFTGGITFQDYPGAIDNAGALTLRDCRVSRNSGRNGGGINNSGTLTLIRTEISMNVGERGGGIYNTGMLSLIHSEINRNGGTFVGGIYNVEGKVMIDAASRVIENRSDTPGAGGIQNDGGSVTLFSSENVTGNTPNNCGDTGVPLCNG